MRLALSLFCLALLIPTAARTAEPIIRRRSIRT